MPRRPKVYFEEWDEPMISGIGWVSELIEAAGGSDIFADRAACKSAKERIVTAADVIARAPDIIIGSWCGKKFRPEKVIKRPGFDRVPAVQRGALHEIKSPLILQPGPAALTDGLAALAAIVAGAVLRRVGLWSIRSSIRFPENLNRMIGKRRARVSALGGASLATAAAVVVNGAVSIAIKSAGLCLRGNGKSMCCNYERGCRFDLVTGRPGRKTGPARHVPKIIETLAAPYESCRSLLPLPRWNDGG